MARTPQDTRTTHSNHDTPTKCDHSYNGWSNYETWAVALWLDNDEGTYNLVRKWARCAEGAGDLSATLREFTEEANPLADTASVFTDLLGAAIESVDWYEVATSLLVEVGE